MLPKMLVNASVIHCFGDSILFLVIYFNFDVVYFTSLIYRDTGISLGCIFKNNFNMKIIVINDEVLIVRFIIMC